MSNTSPEAQRISTELANIAGKLDGANKGKLQLRIDVTTALVSLDKISPKIGDGALLNQYTELRELAEKTAKDLGITTTKAAPNSSLSGNSYASFFSKAPSSSSQSAVAQKSLDSLTQLQKKLAGPTTIEVVGNSKT